MLKQMKCNPKCATLEHGLTPIFISHVTPVPYQHIYSGPPFSEDPCLSEHFPSIPTRTVHYNGFLAW